MNELVKNIIIKGLTSDLFIGFVHFYFFIIFYLI